MTKMRRQKRARKFMTLLGATAIALVACSAAALAADCPRHGTLGTSRILSVDAVTTPRVGLKSFSQTLPLGDHEVVLTFDDGPWPPTTARVLAALADECVRATFFLIGKTASEHPEFVCGAGCARQSQRPMNPKSPVNVIQLRHHSGRDVQ